jgi:D-alanine transaminase
MRAHRWRIPPESWDGSFLENAERIGLHLEYGEHELTELLRKTAQKSGFSEFFIYFQASGHLSERLHAPRSREKSNLLITVKPFSLPDKDKELALVSYPDIRQSFCNVKSLNLLGSALASEYAFDCQCEEAVLVRGKSVTECAHSNIFIVSGGKLITHPLNERILPGIMRREALITAEKMGIEIEERPFSLSELFSASDVFLTSTSKLILRAKSLDGLRLSNEKSSVFKAIIDEMFKCYEDFC